MITIICRHIERLLYEEDANSATEYAILLGLIVLTSIGAISALGSRIAVVFERFRDI